MKMKLGSHGVLVLKMASLVILCMVLGAPRAAEASIRCRQVISYLQQCKSYVASGGPVPRSCCNDLQSLKKLGQTTPDRQAICRCLTQAVHTLRVNMKTAIDRANDLPKKCGIKIPSYKISSSADCKK